MKSWALAAIFVSVAALAACGKSDGGDDDGDGGSGGGTTTDTGTGTNTGTATGTNTGTATGTGTGTATGTGTGACAAEDTAGNCGQGPQEGCLACAVNGPCKTEFTTLAGMPNAQELLECYEPCMDEACLDACDAMYPDEAAAFAAFSECVYCEACYTACDGESQGCQ